MTAFGSRRDGDAERSGSRPQSGLLARHIGRVGALAVALGIGGAVMAGPGVVWAQTSENGSAVSGDTNTDTDQTSRPGGGGDTDAQGPDVDAEAQEVDGADPDLDDAGPDLAGGGVGGDEGAPKGTEETDFVDTGSEEGDLQPDEMTSGSPSVPVQNEPVPPPPPVAATPASANIPSSSSGPDLWTAKRGDTPATSEVVDSGAGAVPAGDVATSSDSVPLMLENAVANTMTAFGVDDEPARRTTATGTGSLTQIAAPTSPIAALLAIPTRIITAVVGVLLSPFLAPAGPAPASPPLFWAVLGWVQRELRHTFFNRSPVLGQPTDIAQNGLIVTGTVTGTDADDDAIIYSVAPSTAQGGTVVVDQQGHFTYIAPQNWSGASPLTDTFTVRVSDAASGFHLHGLAGLFGGGHTSTRAVTVTLAPRSTGVTDTWSISTPPDGPSRSSVGPDGTIAIANRTGSGTAADPYRVTVRVLRPGQDSPTESSALGDFSGNSVTVLADGTVGYTTVVRSADGTADTTVTVVRPGQLDEVLTTPGAALGGLFSNGRTAVQISIVGEFRSPTQQTRATAMRGDQPLQTYFQSGGFAAGSQPQLAGDGTVSFLLTIPGEGDEPATTRLVLMRPSGIITRDGVGLGEPVVADDGTLVFTDWTGAGTADDPYITFLNVWRPGQEATRDPVAGPPGSLSVGSGGTIAYATVSGAGTALDPTTTAVTVLRPGQPAIESTSLGRLWTSYAAPDGTVVYGTFTASDGSANTYGLGTSTITVLRPGQQEISHSALTTDRVPPLVNSTGTVVVADVFGTGASSAPASRLTIYRPGDAPEAVDIAGLPNSLGLGADGTVTFASGRSEGTTTLTVLRPGEEAETFTAPGNPQASPAITDDGTVIQTTRVSSTLAYFTILRPGEPAVTIETPGLVANEPLIGPDGTIYQVTDDRVLGRTNLTIVTTAGEVTRLDFLGSDLPLVIDEAGGRVVLVMVSTGSSGTQTFTGHEITVASATTTKV